MVLTCLWLTTLAQTGTWSGKIEVQGMSLPLVFHLNESDATMDSPAQGVRDIPAQIERKAASGVVVRVPSIGATYEGVWLGKQIMGTFKQHGAAFALTLIPGEERLNRPQTPKAPFDYDTEEVTFSNGDAMLSGTLVLPKGCSRQTPVLIMVTGSGLQNRDEELFEHKPFAVLADALAKAGIATLRYDDRGFGKSTGDVVMCTTEDLKNDALAGMTLLRQRFSRVGVLGHSEGGTIALMLAAEGKADFVVSLAGMTISGKELLLWQNRTMLGSAGIPEATVDDYCRLLAEAFDACVANAPIPSADATTLPDALKQNYQGVVKQLQLPYLRHFVALDVRPMLGKITCPVMALNGTKDTQVACDVNLKALRDGLPASQHHCIEAIEGVNHLFQHCTTGATVEYREIEETMSPQVLDAVVQWLKQR